MTACELNQTLVELQITASSLDLPRVRSARLGNLKLHDRFFAIEVGICKPKSGIIPRGNEFMDTVSIEVIGPQLRRVPLFPLQKQTRTPAC